MASPNPSLTRRLPTFSLFSGPVAPQPSRKIPVALDNPTHSGDSVPAFETSFRAWSPIVYTRVLGILVCLTMVSGCATHAGTGAAAGGLLGAGTGAAIGSATGNAGAGALLGTGLGAIAGTLVGAGMDENDRRNQERIAAATAPPPTQPLSVADVVQMAQSGVGDEVVVSSIRSSRTVFNLSAADVVSLHQQGVSDRVIQEMLDNARRPAVAARPVYVEPGPIYVVEPRPRVHVGFGYGYCRPHPCWW